MVQWLRILLLEQGTWILSLVWGDSTCLRATKPLHHNYWSWHPPNLCCLTRGAPTMRSPWTSMKSSPYFLKLEKARMQQRRPRAAKNKIIKLKKKKTNTWDNKSIQQQNRIVFPEINEELYLQLCYKWEWRYRMRTKVEKWTKK